MCAVQQAFVAVAELAVQQLGYQAAIGSVGHRDQQLAIGGQQRAAGVQNALGLAQVLQHIGADDAVVALASQQGVQVGSFQIGHFHAAVVRAGVGSFGLAPGDAVGSAGAVLGQVLSQGTAAAAQVEYGGALGYPLRQHGQGGALIGVDVAHVNVQILG